MSPETTRVPIAEGLSRAADEARFLSREAEHLDASIAAALGQSSPADSNGLQNADLIRQGLEGLALFLSALATTVDEQGTCCPAQAATKVMMKEQSGRLQNNRPPDGAVKAHYSSELWTG
ncbi:hypothetical protein [Roseinatronobacter sp. S2]|uniref:hypothetical protein n=1 Tax=Roseinatronobacter sp. S2 TaxID=3035471 RepID=UPI00240F2163|nr:hypothetical protein [Roseinatronobacter sp. S2]WFE74031.1 hypothetical protein P8S53_12685 [Roseinatronobacter sp. S2]